MVVMTAVRHGRGSTSNCLTSVTGVQVDGESRGRMDVMEDPTAMMECCRGKDSREGKKKAGDGDE